MPAQPRPPMTLGDSLQVTVFKALGGKRFAANCRAVPRGWSVELHSRHPETVELGANRTTWIARIVPIKKSVLVHDGDFGRLPISDAMLPRYVAAIKAILGETEIGTETLADFRSMVVRIEQKNQADWLTVWKTLGEPETGDVKELLQGVDAMRIARKEDPSSLEGLRLKFATLYEEEFRAALGRLEGP